MDKVLAPHNLLILSEDFEEYKRLIGQEKLTGLSIQASWHEDEVVRKCKACDLVFGEPSRVSKVVNQIPGLTWVQTTWAGVEPLLRPGLRRDYILTNARNVYGPMMSEYVFGYLLAIERQIVSRWQSQCAGKWDGTTPGSLRGKLLGLVGVGTIGHYLADTARHFGMRVYGYTRRSESCSVVERYFHGDETFAFASDLDYLVCSLPETEHTKRLVDAAFLSALPEKAWLLNIGRGSSIDETALVEVLTNHSIAGAILDVFSQEPLPSGHPFWSTPNTFITCHTAARNYLPDIASLFIENYRRFIAGQPLLYQVDFDHGY
jgi:phosphoglycerate dehydrogenase-like enzyme